MRTSIRRAASCRAASDVRGARAGCGGRRIRAIASSRHPAQPRAPRPAARRCAPCRPGDRRACCSRTARRAAAMAQRRWRRSCARALRHATRRGRLARDCLARNWRAMIGIHLAVIWSALAGRVRTGARPSRNSAAGRFTIQGPPRGSMPLSGGWSVEASADDYVLRAGRSAAAAEVAPPDRGAMRWGELPVASERPVSRGAEGNGVAAAPGSPRCRRNRRRWFGAWAAATG